MAWCLFKQNIHHHGVMLNSGAHVFMTRCLVKQWIRIHGVVLS